VTETRRRSTGSPTGLARRREIVRAASRVFAQKGFSSATVRDIADDAGTLSGSLYYYFDSKEAIAEEVLVVYLDEMIAGYREAADRASSPDEALTNLIGLALYGVVRNREEVMILQNDWHYVSGMAGIVERQREVERVWLETIQAGIDQGIISGKHGARMIYRTAMGMILAVVRWFDPKGETSIDDIIRIQSDILLEGIRSR
jgi:AcrR family transcriptional regulator